MRRFVFLLALSLAACDQPAPQPSRKPTGEHGYHAKVNALPSRLRDGVLFRAIRSGGGEACQDVKQVVDQPPAKNGDPAWLVTCSDGAEWYVQLGDDGTALVTAVRTAP
jgi:hypothetical protein